MHACINTEYREGITIDLFRSTKFQLEIEHMVRMETILDVYWMIDLERSDKNFPAQAAERPH
jgi:hypothetical protein